MISRMLKVKELFSAVCSKVLVAHIDYSNNINQFAKSLFDFLKLLKRKSTHFCAAGWYRVELIKAFVCSRHALSIFPNTL